MGGAGNYDREDCSIKSSKKEREKKYVTLKVNVNSYDFILLDEDNISLPGLKGKEGKEFSVFLI